MPFKQERFWGESWGDLKNHRLFLVGSVRRGNRPDCRLQNEKPLEKPIKNPLCENPFNLRVPVRRITHIKCFVKSYYE